MSNETKGHVHAELMAQYAEDARTNAEPWKLWECADIGGDWESFKYGHPTWISSFKYRRKPRTITINGFEVPEPLREAVRGQGVWVVDVASANWCFYYDDASSTWCKRSLSRGLCHATQEDAVTHAKALLSFTERKE